MGEYTTFFVAVGMFTTLIIISVTTYYLGVFSYYSFREWRRNKCKFKCLFKHTYNINWISRDEDMVIECINCHKRKRLHFDKKSLKAFMH